MVGLPQGDSPFLLDSSYTITADITVPEGGAEGMILTSGGRFAGYGFYLLKGKPVFLWNLVDLKRIKWEGPEALTPGKHTLEFDFKYDGFGVGTLAFNNMSGLGRSGTGTLKVDGKAVQTIEMKRTLPMILQWDESFDIGSDTLTGVNDADYTAAVPADGQARQADDQGRSSQADRPRTSRSSRRQRPKRSTARRCVTCRPGHSRPVGGVTTRFVRKNVNRSEKEEEMGKLNLKRAVGLFAVGVLTLWASGLTVVWAETSAVDPAAVQIL